METSEVEVNRVLNAIEPYIRAEAVKGKRELRFAQVQSGIQHDKFSGSVGPFEQTKVTPLQQAVIDALAKLGYGAKLELYGDKYVPRGLQSGYDDDAGPQHQNYSIIVRW